MSDDDERVPNSNTTSIYEMNNHRLAVIKSKLHELTREKTKYNVEKLTHDAEFIRNEIDHLNQDIYNINKEINTQTNIKRNLNAKVQILRSSSRLRYPNLEIALRDKERYEKELEKAEKSEGYRDLARQKVESIIQALPQLQEQAKYAQQLDQAESAQITARNRREKFVENLNSKSRKQVEIKQLLADSATKLPEIEAQIENLRLERENILMSTGKKKQRHQLSSIQQKSIDPSIQSVSSLKQATLEYEKQDYNERLENIHSLIRYFQEKISEYKLSMNDISCSTPPSELMSPLYQPIALTEERTTASAYMEEQVHDNDITKTTTTNESTVAIAMKLPRNFIPLDLKSTATNEIVHSPYYQESPFEYKKELPSDIVDKYAGITNKKQQQQQQQSTYRKKNKKNKKSFRIKHSPQTISLYNDVRQSSGNSDLLPLMPMYEYELLPTIEALELFKKNIESYLIDLSEFYQAHSSKHYDEEHSEIVEDDDIRDSALDTFSEQSSLVETTDLSNNLTHIPSQPTDVPQAHSSSSSDEKRTIVLASSPSSSHHSNTKGEQQFVLNVPLTTVEELPSHLSLSTIHIAQIDRQISDEGYRSVRNSNQSQTTSKTNNLLSLTRSQSYDCNEKVGQWLSTATESSFLPIDSENLNQNDYANFQATNIDNDDEKMVESIIPVTNNCK